MEKKRLLGVENADYIRGNIKLTDLPLKCVVSDVEFTPINQYREIDHIVELQLLKECYHNAINTGGKEKADNETMEKHLVEWVNDKDNGMAITGDINSRKMVVIKRSYQNS